MKKNLFLLCLLIISSCATGILKRENGLSLYMHPYCVAEDTDNTNKWGFVIKETVYQKKWITFKLPKELIKYYNSLPKKIRVNGIWIVTTNPKAYSIKEIKRLEQLKQMCVNKNIPLFLCRGAKLPSGWKKITSENINDKL